VITHDLLILQRIVQIMPASESHEISIIAKFIAHELLLVLMAKSLPLFRKLTLIEI